MRTLMAATIILGAAALPLSGQISTDEPTITGQGAVDVLLSPARAVVLASIVAEGALGSEATAELQRLDAAIRAAAERAGARVSPYGYGLGENQQIRRMYPQQPPLTTSRDYIARSGLAIEVDGLDAVPELVTALSASGLNTVTAVLYLPDPNDPAVQAAVAHATELAQANAEQMARAAGGRLGRLLRVWPSSAGGQSPLLRFQPGDPSGVPLQPSDVLKRVAVQGMWEFIAR